MAARARLRIWAKRCAPNAICPGTTATSLPETWREILDAGAPDMNRGLGMASAERLRDIVPLRSRGTPGDVAGVAVYLAFVRVRLLQRTDPCGGWRVVCALAALNAGITSRENRSNCSRITRSSVPTT